MSGRHRNPDRRQVQAENPSNAQLAILNHPISNLNGLNFSSESIQLKSKDVHTGKDLCIPQDADILLDGLFELVRGKQFVVDLVGRALSIWAFLCHSFNYLFVRHMRDATICIVSVSI